MSEITKEKVLAYHKQGKIGIDLMKPCDSQYEFSLPYYVKAAYHNDTIVKSI